MNKITSILLAGLAAGMVASPSRGDQPITQEELVRRTQELFDASCREMPRRGKNIMPTIV